MKGLSRKERAPIRKAKEQIAKAKEEEALIKRNTETEKKKYVRKEKKVEFPYIDEVLKEELNGTYIYIDPGKRSLFTMMNDEGKFLSYTNSQRMKETKRLKYQQLLKNHRDEIGITEKEKCMCALSLKTCNEETFKMNMTEKNIITNSVKELYQDVKFRKYKWYAYLNNKKSIDNMIQIIKDTFLRKDQDQSDLVIIIGDWSINKQMRNFISTPNLTLKRELSKHFKVYNIDEYRTSALHFKTEEYTDNLWLKDAEGTLRKKHSILTYKMENNRLGCINRDRNSCKNIKKLFDYYIETGSRPIRYQRGIDISLPPKQLIKLKLKFKSQKSKMRGPASQTDAPPALQGTLSVETSN